MKRQYHIQIDTEQCKGCGLCIAVCPKGVLILDDKLNSRGNHIVTPRASDQCSGCLMCCDICPDVAIEIDEETG